MNKSIRPLVLPVHRQPLLCSNSLDSQRKSLAFYNRVLAWFHWLTIVLLYGWKINMYKRSTSSLQNRVITNIKERSLGNSFPWPVAQTRSTALISTLDKITPLQIFTLPLLEVPVEFSPVVSLNRFSIFSQPSGVPCTGYFVIHVALIWC